MRDAVKRCPTCDALLVEFDFKLECPECSWKGDVNDKEDDDVETLP